MFRERRCETYFTGMQGNITNGTHIQNLGKYLDTVKKKWFNKMKDM
jgi:hypothetical protein